MPSRSPCSRSLSVRDPGSFVERSSAVQAAAIAAMGAAGVALAALQPRGATELAAARRCGWRSHGCRSRSGPRSAPRSRSRWASRWRWQEPLRRASSHRAPVRAARGDRVLHQAGAREPGPDRAAARRARGRARGAARGRGGRGARPDRERAARCSRPFALRRRDPASGRADARGARAGERRCARRSTAPASS